jgi:hypothetical protein
VLAEHKPRYVQFFAPALVDGGANVKVGPTGSAHIARPGPACFL